MSGELGEDTFDYSAEAESLAAIRARLKVMGRQLSELTFNSDEVERQLQAGQDRRDNSPELPQLSA